MIAKGNSIQTKIQEAETCYLINSLFPDKNIYNTAISDWNAWFPKHYLEVKEKPTDGTYDVSGIKDEEFAFLKATWRKSFYYQLTGLKDFCDKNGWNINTAKAYHWDTGNFAMKEVINNFVTSLGFHQKDNCFKADIVVFFDGTNSSIFSGNKDTYEDFRNELLEQYEKHKVLPISLKQLSGRPLSHVTGLYGASSVSPSAVFTSFEAPIGVNDTLIRNLESPWNNKLSPSCATTLFADITGMGHGGKNITRGVSLCIRTFTGVSSYPNITIATQNAAIDLGALGTYKVTAVNLGKIGSWLNKQTECIEVKKVKIPRKKATVIQGMKIKPEFFPIGTIESNTIHLTEQKLTNATKFTPVPNWLNEFYDKMRTTAIAFGDTKISLADLLVSCTINTSNRKFVQSASEINSDTAEKIVESLRQQKNLCGVDVQNLDITKSQIIVYNLSLICWHLIVMANIDTVFTKLTDAIDTYQKKFDIDDYISAGQQYFVECYKAAAGEDTFSDKYKKLVDLCLYSA